jgi:hypothetical protein
MIFTHEMQFITFLNASIGACSLFFQLVMFESSFEYQHFKESKEDITNKT